MVCAFARSVDQFDIEPTVEANGNKPISPLSVAAELLCVSVNELELRRRPVHRTARKHFRYLAGDSAMVGESEYPYTLHSFSQTSQVVA